MTPILGPDRLATYVLLPGMFFWTSIEPRDPGGWKNTKINRHGTIRARNQVSEPGAGRFLVDRVAAIDAMKDSISPVQQGRIGDSLRNAGADVVDSKSFEAWLDDQRIQRENKIRR